MAIHPRTTDRAPPTGALNLTCTCGVVELTHSLADLRSRPNVAATTSLYSLHPFSCLSSCSRPAPSRPGSLTRRSPELATRRDGARVSRGEPTQSRRAPVLVPRRISRLGASPRNNYVVRRAISATHRSPARRAILSLSPPGGNLRALGRPMAAGPHRVPSWHVVCRDVPSMGCRIAAEDDDHPAGDLGIDWRHRAVARMDPHGQTGLRRFPAGSRWAQQGSRVRTHSIMALR